MPPSHELWFRAEDADHSSTRLQPGLYRPTKRSKLGKSVQKMLSLECELYEEFGRCASQLSPADAQSIDDEWDSYFLMQHHGVPTRLLDWSDGDLISLHFAVKGKTLAASSDSIIYMLDPYWLMRQLDKHPDRKDAERRWKEYWHKKRPADTDEDDWDRLYLPFGADNPKEPLLNMPALPLLWDSPRVTRRIAAQRSRFMVFGTDPFYLATIERRANSRLVPVTLPKGAISRIRQELRDAGITESVVYPDLDGLGRELKQRWESER
jgi:FRG domain